jgi:hypothetical protein
MKELKTKLKAVPSLGRIIHIIEPHECGEKKELPDEINHMVKELKKPKAKSVKESNSIPNPFPPIKGKPSNAEFESMKGSKSSNIESSAPDGILSVIKRK